MSMSSNQRDGNTIKFSFKLNNQTLLHRWLYSRVSNRRDSPLINYSVFCHPPQPWSALPVYYFWRILPASPFISDSQFINSSVQSTAVAWSLGKAAKLFDVHVFFNKHDVYKDIQGQVCTSYREATLVFLMFFLLINHKIVWWFYFNEISNCRVFASLPVYSNLPVHCTLPVYYFGRNLPGFPFILSSPSIWNSRVLKHVVNTRDFSRYSVMAYQKISHFNSQTFLLGFTWNFSKLVEA